MKKRSVRLLAAMLCLGTTAGLNAQTTLWHNPLKADRPVVQGQADDPRLAGTFDRLSEADREPLRPALRSLSTHSAGLALHFYTDSPHILVRYGVSGAHAMTHMPATGVSGVDLYSIDDHGAWLYRRPFNWSFSDTVRYSFTPITDERYPGRGYEYRLYLPLYNRVEWMEIGVDSAAMFRWIPRRTERPVAAYGTSILQGGCASRPGMAWTNILSRKLDRTVLNFGFSANGQMDAEIIEALVRTDARLYILDCIPNLVGFEDSDFRARYIDGIERLRSRTDAPILLAEDVSGGKGFALPVCIHKNELLKACFRKLTDRGVEGLHYLSCEEIDMPGDGTVDGIHLNDLGMKALAEAHERKIRAILRETDDRESTTRAVTQRREYPGYEWLDRHEALEALNHSQPPRNVMLGNSITHYWGGSDGRYPENGSRSWEKHMAPAGFRNLGYGNDRIENVLWRVRHGELDGYRAERVVLLIGVNNFSCNDDDQIAAGIAALVEAVRDRQPDARIEVLGILPCRNAEKRVEHVNALIEERVRRQGIASFRDVGHRLLGRDGTIDEALFLDGLHPNEKGYACIARLIAEGTDRR
ncbi:SGNH/GDSL hydrolase family protein [uncultured Alistipes sp.]|uniref:SGNH/GDSL hydrolase family protein n=1 Tax=uncultured Alistipes sp. TaxID=538949 RepID=UPI0026234744|nr:SGNH/GDSL hydrolase family protein [uncultured Alistipes sp.]